jgi:hypothetical protein
MKIFSLILLVMPSLVADAKNPFVQSPSPKLRLEQKYQYLGYIKGPKRHYGFIRRSGGEVERLSMGNNPGLGKIVVLSQERICLRKKNKTWCLMKSPQLRPWMLE